MPRKKKPNRTDGRFEYKATIGKTIDGKLIRKSFYSSTSIADAKRQAEEYKIQQEVSLRTGDGFQSDDTFESWAIKWLTVYKQPNVSENTYISSYRNPVERYLLPYFGRARLTEIRPIDVQNFFAQHQDLSMSYLKKLRMCLSAIYEAAIDNGVYCRNPVRHEKLVSKTNKNEKQVYTDAQIRAVKDLARHECPQVFFLLETGLRRGELCGLMWQDVDLDSGTLHIRRAVRVTHGVVSIAEPKHGSQRVLPISPDLSELLHSLTRDTMYVFPNAAGKPRDPNGLALTIKRFMAGLPEDIPRLTAHELRHTYGTMLRRHGVDIHTIQKLLGHKDIEITANTYVHAEIDAMRAELEAKRNA